jgi:hypothetical protein
MNDKFFIEAEIKLQEETKDLRQAVASVIDLPSPTEKQDDLLYFTALFVSTGANLNGAYFLPSELVKAEDTIVSKALDVEHKEEEIIGHIYDRAFVDYDGSKLELAELKSKEAASLDSEYSSDMHVIIAGVIYKNRFPSLAKEVSNGEWKVSMECYFANYDVKVGDVVLSRPDAEMMGLTSDSTVFGKIAKIIKKGKEIAKGKVERVLRDIMFSGCGVVKNPANPPSVIMETANEKVSDTDPKEVVILDYDKLETENAENKLTFNRVEEDTSVITEDSETEESDLQYDDTIGICVNYKRRVYVGEPEGPDTEVVHEDWCNLYNQACTSFGRDTSDPECLRNTLGCAVKQYAKKLIKQKQMSDKRAELTKELEDVLKNASRFDK